MLFEGMVFVALRLAENKLRPPVKMPRQMFLTVQIIGRFLLLPSPKTLLKLDKKRHGINEITSKTFEMVASITPVPTPPMMDHATYSQLSKGMFGQRDSNAGQNTNQHQHQNHNGDESSEAEEDDEIARSMDQVGDVEFRQLQWRYLAEIIDRFTFLFYIACLFITPLVMFAIIPASEHTNYN